MERQEKGYSEMIEEESKISEREDLLENIYNTIPYGILRFARGGGGFRIISMNREALRLLACDNMEEFKAQWDERNGTAGGSVAGGSAYSEGFLRQAVRCRGSRGD